MKNFLSTIHLRFDIQTILIFCNEKEHTMYVGLIQDENAAKERHAKLFYSSSFSLKMPKNDVYV
jgi:hypothetical protein